MDRFLPLRKGLYVARLATSPADIAAAQTLRACGFGVLAGGPDIDAFDAKCQHMLIEEVETGALVCCFRFLLLPTGAEILDSYSAQFYDLSALSRFAGPLLEIGRFCMAPTHRDPDILRIAWGAITQWVDAAGVRLLFGCSSFAGDDVAMHKDAFELLYGKHRAPEQWRPRSKAQEVFDFELEFSDRQIACTNKPVALPPLLRSYLLMGAGLAHMQCLTVLCALCMCLRV